MLNAGNNNDSRVAPYSSQETVRLFFCFAIPELTKLVRTTHKAPSRAPTISQ